MASPQRHDPGGFEPHFEPELDTSLPPRSTGRRLAFAWWWILLTAVVIFVLAWAIWGWSGTGGWWSAGRTQTGPPANTSQRAQPQIRGLGLEILTATDRRPFVGRNFQVSTVPVIRTDNSQAVWIGTKTTPPMLLILGSGAVPANTHIVAGSLLDVTGTVEKAPSAAQARSEWNLGANTTSQLEKQGVYIQATRAYAIQSPQSQ